MTSRVLMAAAISGAIIVGTAAFLAERATLIVDANAPVWANVPWPNTKQQKIAVLPAGIKPVVYSCIDIKHYFVYEIRLADGRIGYVDSGSGRPQVRSALLPPYSQPIVWNCP